MRLLPDDLLTAQQQAPFRLPHARIRISSKRAGVHHPTWTRTYTGAEPIGPHGAYSAAADHLFQLRINLTDDHLHRRHILNPHDIDQPTSFGYETAAPNEVFADANHKAASRFTPTDDITLDTITAYIRGDKVGAKAKAVIYSDNAGAPGALLGTSDENASIPTSDAWVPFTFSTPVNVTAGTAYWLGALWDADIFYHHHDEDAPLEAYAADTYADGPTNPFGTPDGYSYSTMSIYASGLLTLNWTDCGVHAHDCDVAGHAHDLVAVYIANAAPFHVFYATSPDGGLTWSAWTDTGMVSDTNGRVAVAVYDTSNYVIFYTRGAQLYARELKAASWQAEDSSEKTFSLITGLAAHSYLDYNVIITGKDASSKPGVWATQFGYTYGETHPWWAGPFELLIRASTEDYEYLDPHLTHRNGHELTFVEHHTGPTARYASMHSHTTYEPVFTDYGFSEPIPMNYATPYSPAMCAAGAYEWNCTPDTIEEASSSTAYWDITSDVVDVTEQLLPGNFRSKITVILDNTAGKFNTFNRLGDEIVIEWGFETDSGILYSPSPPSWITGWRFLSPAWFPLRSWYPYGVVGTLQIDAEDVWGILARWKAPRSFTWAAGEKNIWQMLAWLFARAGLGYEIVSQSDDLTNVQPELQVTAGTSGRTLVKKILTWVPDVIRQGVYAMENLNPLADDESVYTYDNMYGVSHLLFRGDYRFMSWDPNRVIVESDTITHEDDEFTQIAKVDERLKRVTSPDYTVEADAANRAAAELRKGQMWNAKGGWIQVSMNCGQEVFDVITITDTSAGLVTQNFRVIGIKTHWNKRYWTCIQQLLLADV